jgi:hypothetical protein
MSSSSAARARARSIAVAVGATAAATALAGCGYSGSQRQQVQSWVAQTSFVVNERQVLADVRSVELAAQKGSALQLRTVCGGLSSDAGTLYSSLPTPDHALTDQLGASMQDLYDAAESCAVASSTTSPAVRRDLARIERGLAALARARVRLQADGVRSPIVSVGTVTSK